jgi:hypothetical protein
MDKVYGPDVEETELIKLEFFIGADNPELGSKNFQHFASFKDACLEDWIKCLLVNVFS